MIHEPVSCISGEITCSCGYITPHAAHTDDAWEMYDEHLEAVGVACVVR